MRKLATTLLVLLGLAAATSAFALDLRPRLTGSHSPVRVNSRGMTTAVLGCDDGYFANAYYQGTDDRLGNQFSFGSGTTLSRVAFAHYGFGFPGPYNYDIEIWDPTSCTFVTSKDNLIAADAANDIAVEDVDLCSDHIYLAGNLLVMLDPNSCLAPNDCYPDLLFDDQLDVECPWIINNASTGAICYDVAPYNGPFLLRIEVDNCPVPAKRTSWGELKTLYR